MNFYNKLLENNEKYHKLLSLSINDFNNDLDNDNSFDNDIGIFKSTIKSYPSHVKDIFKQICEEADTLKFSDYVLS